MAGTREQVRFNYIITIHNKESLIERVLRSVMACAGDKSLIYCVLDGCTDSTEEIVDRILGESNDNRIVKIIEYDVHELLSINSGLKNAAHEGNGFNIILQDDVILKDQNIEDKVKRLYDDLPELGYLSFRLGANLKDDWFLQESGSVPYHDRFENCCGHGVDAQMLPLGCFVEKDVPIKSPVCIPFKIIREVGLYDEILAPYGLDDLDYALRVIGAGYTNGVYALEFGSELEWGGTRQIGKHVVDKIITRNMQYLREKHRSEIKIILDRKNRHEILSVDQMPTISHEECVKIWNRKKKHQKISIYFRILNITRRLIKNALKRVERVYYGYIYMPSNSVSSFKHIPNDLCHNEVYLGFHHYYNKHLPAVLREHRRYVLANQLGYGEDAFHAMWWVLFNDFRPKKVLEIGVYKGQVLSLWALIAKALGYEIDVYGVTPLAPIGDAVSKYDESNYYDDITALFDRYSLKNPTLHKGLSTAKDSVEFITATNWDLIYIDGGHDFSVAKHDYEVAKRSLKKGGVLVIDDSALFTDYKSYSFTFPGHTGPSLVASLFADRELKSVARVGHNSIYLMN